MKILAALIRFSFFLSVFCTASSHLAIAVPIGSYTFTYMGVAPDNTKVRITAVSETPKNGQPTTVDFTMDISGLTGNGAAANLALQLNANNIENKINPQQSSSVNAFDFVMGTSGNLQFLRVKKVDGGSDKAGFEVRLDGTDVDIQRGVAPGEKWKASFTPGLDPTQGVTVAGNLVIDIPGIDPLSIFLDVGTEPEDAALALLGLLRNNGFSDAELEPGETEVSFLLSPFGGLISEVTEFAFEGVNLHYGLEIPTAIAEPATLTLLGSGLLGLLAYRRRSGSARPGTGRAPRVGSP
jgi:hypothetical protein